MRVKWAFDHESFFHNTKIGSSKKLNNQIESTEMLKIVYRCFYLYLCRAKKTSPFMKRGVKRLFLIDILFSVLAKLY